MAAVIETDDPALPEFPASLSEPEDNKLSFDDYRAMLTIVGSGAIPTYKPGSLVKVIHAGGSRPAIFWAFNRPGYELEMLARVMGSDQPLYGLYSGSSHVKIEKLPAIAEHYVREIQAIQPTGPLLIAGNCRAGRLAIKIAMRMRESGREVSHLCILEKFERPLYDFDGKLLLLFGKQSKRFRYRDLNYGRTGWSLPFRHPPRVGWIRGCHGEFFDPQNVGSIVPIVREFLDDIPDKQSLSARIGTRLLLLIHRFKPIFKLYVRLTYRAGT
jgi:hypothetical protein